MQKIAALFDFDGVIMDTEKQYSVFWKEIGQRLLGIEGFETQIKGQTLTNILEQNFKAFSVEEKQGIISQLDKFEANMKFEYVTGFLPFLEDLKRNDVATAVVTSSNVEKMENVYKAYPDFKDLFDIILTAEHFSASKPAPDCYLLGMQLLHTDAMHSFVFEDSINGLKAGQASRAKVIGLTTSNNKESIACYCHHVIDNFEQLSYDTLIRI